MTNKKKGGEVVQLGDTDLHLFNEGRHFRIYEKLGCHLGTKDTKEGAYFSVWAPNANRVSVVGDFNGWEKHKDLLSPIGATGIWTGFLPGVVKGQAYKYHISSNFNGYTVDKADPFAFYAELPPDTASIVWDLDYEWKDESWLKNRKEFHGFDKACSIYEVHLGSWARKVEEDSRFLTYRELAEKLPQYVKELGFTHVELLPVQEHPFYPSWGYQVTGYFAPTSRYGTPQDFMYLVDKFHEAGIGVILDWVPSHFPKDEHGLGYFDGTHLFEHSDWRQGYHPDWGTLIFNYGRFEVINFLISNALFWFRHYHLDGLRVDAVASMLYLDYSRKEGEWLPNQYGGRENLEALSFIRQLNEEVYREFPDIHMIAEESTAWGLVSRPTSVGGLGFGMKWDMGWMHDMLEYVKKDSIHRKFHHNSLTFRMLYAFSENFVLSLSHDEVVHGKGSLIGKMPGDPWQKFANLRVLYSYMYAQPGKKLLFMGSEFGQWKEWDFTQSLDWNLIDWPLHKGLQRLVAELNRIYKTETAFHEVEFGWEGFEWLEANDAENSVLTWIRKSRDCSEFIIAVFNFTPIPRYNYRVGAPFEGVWAEIFNSDAKDFGGSGHGNFGGLETVPAEWQGRPFLLNVTIPPLGGVYFKWKKPQIV